MRNRGAAADERWEAVVARAAGVDDRFVYAVATTGIYCRSGCGSRRPRRENVMFFNNPRAARAAGFRACKRCHPDDPSAPSEATAKVVEACRYIERVTDRIPTLEELGREVGLSP